MALDNKRFLAELREVYWEQKRTPALSPSLLADIETARKIVSGLPPGPIHLPCFVCSNGVRSSVLPVSDLAVIGRDPAGDVVLDCASVSPRHCEVRRDPDGWVITDLDSIGGVYVNGVKRARAWLRDGAFVVLGKQALVFLCEEPVPFEL